jgi:hypothetical protein
MTQNSACAVLTPNGDVVLVLTQAETLALYALAGEGAEGILRDPEASMAYIGNDAQVRAASRAIEKLARAGAMVSRERVDRARGRT